MSTSENILKELNKAVKALNFYPDNHPNLDGAINSCYAILTKALAVQESIEWTVDKRGFYERQQPILSAQGWLATLAKEFFLRHIKGIAFSRGVSLDEFKTFLSLLKEEPESLLKRGSVGAQIASQGIKGINIEDVQYQDVHKTTKEVEEEQEEPSLDFKIEEEGEEEEEEAEAEGETGIFEAESLESILQGIDGLDELDEDEKEKTLPELLEELNVEIDAGRYLGVASDISDRVAHCCAENEWDRVFPIIEVFLLHSSQEGQKPEAIASIAHDTLRALLTGETIIHLIDRLKHSKEENIAAIQQMLLIAEQEGMILLLNALAEIKEAHARRTIYDTLLLYGETVRDEAERRINDERWFVVRQMVSLLGEIGSFHSMEVLGKALNHSELRVRKEVIKSLGKIPCRDSSVILLSTLSGSDKSLVPNVIIALGVLKDPAAIESLGELAHKRNALSYNLEIRKEAVKSLGLIGNERAIPTLTRLISRKVWFGKQENEELRAFAVISLGKIGGEAARRVIEHTVKSAQGIVRHACDKTLKEMV
ncbi:MAG: HEAT repeat domain-containing protein [Deltaproteobacteria bacterium]|nr:HEAT repeat domain-containing protein [Deltaproteobacteria bacterium]